MTDWLIKINKQKLCSKQSSLNKGGGEAGGIFYKEWLIFNGRHLPYNPNNIERAKEMRKNMTKAECRIWFHYLKDLWVKVLRQNPIYNYIVDFYIASENLVIEIDWDSHNWEEAILYDQQRTELLKSYGLRVIRFTNREIMENLEWVKDIIDEYLNNSKIA